MAIIEKIQVGGSTYDIGVQGPHISGQIPVDTLPSIPATKLSGTIPEGNLPIIPASKLPSYVDDVIEGYYSGGKFYSDDKKANLIIGEKGKIYVDITTTKGLSYRCTTNDSNTQTYISINGSNNISKNVVANTASSNANAAAANGSVYLNHLEESSVTSSHKISGSGATTVTADASGNIIIKSTDTNTDTKVTSAANHYDPTKETISTLGGAASTDTPAAWGTTDFITGVTIKKDPKGHITGLTLTSAQMPANPNTDKSVTAAAYHYTPASDTNSTITKNASSSVSAGWNSTSLVTGISVYRDSKGHVTDVALTSVKMPSNPNTDTHYISKNVVANTASSNANAAAANGSVYLNHLEESSVTSSHKISGSGATTVTADASGNIIIKSTDTNTHYESKNIVGLTASSTTNTSAAITTNGSVYLNHIENGVLKSSHNIKGNGATTVTADASGNIIINSKDTNTDTKVTNTLNTTTKGYITATTGAATNTGTQIFDTGVYLGTSAGYLHATTFVGSLSGNATTATTATKLSTTGHNLVGGGITTVTSNGNNIVISTAVSYNSGTKTLILG